MSTYLTPTGQFNIEAIKAATKTRADHERQMDIATAWCMVHLPKADCTAARRLVPNADSLDLTGLQLTPYSKLYARALERTWDDARIQKRNFDARRRVA